MFTKRNIVIYFGFLLALMSLCVSTAAAADVTVGVTVSPDNLAIGIGDPTGTKKPQFMAITIDNMANGENYNVEWINISTVEVSVTDGTNTNTVGSDLLKEDPEITDADGQLEDYPNEMILMYTRNNLFIGDEVGETIDIYNPAITSLTFTVSGKFLEGIDSELAGKSFEGTYDVTLKHITKGGKKPR